MMDKKKSKAQLEIHISRLREAYAHFRGKNVMVLFSGGLDTSFITHLLTHEIGAYVTTFSGVVGSVTKPKSMHEVIARSAEVGAIAHTEVDCQDALAALGVYAVQAEAQLGNGYGHHPASSLSRVVIAQAAIRYARDHKIQGIFHGSNGSQNNPYRFHSAFETFQISEGYEVEECTPNLIDKGVPRDLQVLYLEENGIPLETVGFEKTVSHDRNLLGDEWEESDISNPEKIFDIRFSKALEDSALPDQSLRLGLRFKNGWVTELQIMGEAFKEMKSRDVFLTLNKLGLSYRLGIFDYPEGRPIGVRAREVHIAPAMHILIKARNWLKSYLLDDYTLAKLHNLSQHWSRLVMEKNLYCHPAREEIDRVFELFGRDINGDVFLTLEKGTIVNLHSPHAEKYKEGSRKAANFTDVQHYLQKNKAWEDAVFNLSLEDLQAIRRERNCAFDSNILHLERVEQLEKLLFKLDRLDVLSMISLTEILPQQ